MNALQLANYEDSLLPENKMIGKKILIVDDQEHLRELIQLCLEDLAGWNTLVAASGQECLQILQTERPNAILLDISMPGMDGFAVYDLLQSDPITRSIPVILLTARVLSTDMAKFAKMGVAGLIPKPFEATTLPGKVAEILGWDD
ncbi:response regulator receiver protein [Oscillatoria nigro-viridis PCC 7112]|uniref:Response regulator receiver protein n=2 Tax=Phormidium nigroviride TaxID=482564 RepID=K9VC30_9CYAN|nr:response regulator receiver protein [Oscillatoria nigro-viridis PCC 7112]